MTAFGDVELSDGFVSECYRRFGERLERTPMWAFGLYEPIEAMCRQAYEAGVRLKTIKRLSALDLH